ncbi:MAG: hypothetical protein JXJ20_13560 [Anaerolineae bacterium]|jgi:hypothetical protein|nr:hypothetical protein [Anaerolineae bacterium]
MMRRKSQLIALLVGVLILSLGLVACGGDDSDDDGDSAPDTTPEQTAAAADLDLGVGPDLALGAAENSGLPGCNDPNDTECPVPLDVDLDGEASAGGVTVSYPARYFDAVTGNDAPDGVLIEIAPNEKYAFEEQATFQVYFAGSVDAALAELDDPLIVEWSTETLSGTVGVVKDRDQDPPENTTIGAFALDDGRAVVLKLATTGQYGWDLYSRIFERMVGSLVVTG